MLTLKKTVLIDEHKKIKAKLVDFAGFEMPIQYEGIIAEHNAVRKNIGVFEKIVLESINIKVRVVESDPCEVRGFRDILNYGHTFAHAFEASSGYRSLTHGVAVACGMIAAGDLALKLGMVRREVVERQKRLIEKAGLPTSLKGLDLNTLQISRYFLVDKKVRGGKVKFILPQGIGKLLVVKGISPSLVKETLEQLI